MSLTNFAQLTDEELTVWSRDIWKAARNMQFLNRYTGSDANAMIQRITELTKTEKGARAVITLVADLEGDGVAGDRTLEGNEEAGKAYDQVIQIDQIRHANRHEGKMAEQRSVVNFREQSRDTLAYWLADRSDQLAFLTMSGVAYTQKTNGPARVGSDFPFLEFAADVTAPSANRHYRWDAASGLVRIADDAITNLVAADVPTWNMLVDMKAAAVDNYIRPMRAGLETGEGLEVYNVFMTPLGMAALKKDDDFLKAWREAMPRTPNHPMFKGTDVIYIDGLAIRQFRHVYNTKGLASGSKWGSGAVDGQRVIMAGAQAMGYADIGMAEWVEKGFDYDNQQGISVGKILGMKKPVFRSQVTASDEDFGVLVVDTAI